MHNCVVQRILQEIDDSNICTHLHAKLMGKGEIYMMAQGFYTLYLCVDSSTSSGSGSKGGR